MDRILVRPYLPGEDPARGDVIVFDTPPATLRDCGAGGVFVSRLVGFPGELVQDRDGTIFVDDVELEEPYLDASPSDSRPGLGSSGWEVPQDTYFVLGDNRSQSCDSRIWGGVPRESVIGKVVLRYWPPDRIGRLP